MTTTLTLALHRDEARDGAILVSEGNNARGGKCKPVWLPRSLIKYRPLRGKFESVVHEGRTLHLQIVEVELSERVATEKGLA